MFGLGSIFGRPIQSDNATAVGSRPSVACILVEIDISKSHPNSVWIGPNNLDYIQKVVMEGLPSLCSHCKEVGHKNSNCVKLHHLLRKVAAPVMPNLIVPEVVMPHVLNDLAIDNEECGNASSHDVAFPISVGKLVGNLDPSPGVALVGAHLVGPSFDKLYGVNQLALDVAVNPSEGDIVVNDNVILPVVVSPNAILSNIVLPVSIPCLLSEKVVEPFALSLLGKGCTIAVASSDCPDLPDVAGVVQQLDVWERDEICDFGAASPEGGFRPGTMVTWPFSDGDDPLSKSFNDPIFTVPITIVPRDVMLSHLSRDSEVLHGDWLHDESFNEDDSASRDNFNLSFLQIVDADFSNKSAKCKKRKSKKKRC
ncbi:hypothetical protein KFK09_005025 [Dendrobium nobile]|uniref:Uncharacterized protein n=1 Tax=Dendrobium nobile TaxID=94219 RepID=A0A8T3BUK2_DENNO|nr:hypothetical protein KFK09_005025 [Dendrobium nobile]